MTHFENGHSVYHLDCTRRVAPDRTKVLVVVTVTRNPAHAICTGCPKLVTCTGYRRYLPHLQKKNNKGVHGLDFRAWPISPITIKKILAVAKIQGVFEISPFSKFGCNSLTYKDIEKVLNPFFLVLCSFQRSQQLRYQSENGATSSMKFFNRIPLIFMWIWMGNLISVKTIYHIIYRWQQLVFFF